MNNGSNGSFLTDKYSEIRLAARSVRYATRTLPHFPRTANSLLSRLIRLRSSVVNSETRNPVE